MRMKLNSSVLWMGLLIPAFLALWIDRQPGASGKPRSIADFETRIQQYSKTREEAVRKVERLPRKSEPEQIAEHRKALAQAIRTARTGAKQGDIFAPEIAAQFKHMIAAETTGPGSAPTRSAVNVGNPARDGDLSKFKMAVNAQYPGDQPVSMVPPSLLLRLPELPKGLEYRFVDKHLVLLDTEPGLIVDFIPEALP
jgi:hypothetical protein